MRHEPECDAKWNQTPQMPTAAEATPNFKAAPTPPYTLAAHGDDQTDDNTTASQAGSSTVEHGNAPHTTAWSQRSTKAGSSIVERGNAPYGTAWRHWNNDDFVWRMSDDQRRHKRSDYRIEVRRALNGEFYTSERYIQWYGESRGTEMWNEAGERMEQQRLRGPPTIATPSPQQDAVPRAPEILPPKATPPPTATPRIRTATQTTDTVTTKAAPFAPATVLPETITSPKISAPPKAKTSQKATAPPKAKTSQKATAPPKETTSTKAKATVKAPLKAAPPQGSRTARPTSEQIYEAFAVSLLNSYRDATPEQREHVPLRMIKGAAEQCPRYELEPIHREAIAEFERSLFRCVSCNREEYLAEQYREQNEIRKCSQCNQWMCDYFPCAYPIENNIWQRPIWYFL